MKTTLIGSSGNDELNGDIFLPPSSLSFSFGTLSYPIQISNGELYYLFGLTNRINLENIFNLGGEIYETQAQGLVNGIDDARTIVVGEYTVALPTYQEWTNFYYDTKLQSAPPQGWATHHYWLAQPSSEASNLGYGTVLWYNPHPLHWGPDGDTAIHYAAFRVLMNVSTNDILSGMEGDDILFGGGGNDELDGGDGIDTASYSDKTSSILIQLNGHKTSIVKVGDVAEDTLINIENVIGGSGSDIFIGDQNNNNFQAGDGDDLLSRANLEEGLDFFDGGSGNDMVNFSKSKIGLFTDLNYGVVSAFRNESNYQDKTVYDPNRIINTEQIIGSNYDDYIFGSQAANMLNGLDGNDALRGGDGDDQLFGEAGTDMLMGDSGNDVLTGGAGKDIFVFASFSSGLDVITDFKQGEDKIRLLKSAFESLGSKIKTSNVVNVNLDLTNMELGLTHTDLNYRLIFNEWNHSLYYDKDGSGIEPAYALVELTGVNLLSKTDFELC